MPGHRFNHLNIFSARWFWIVVASLMVLTVIVWGLQLRSNRADQSNNEMNGGERVTRTAAPEDIEVPEPGSTSADAAVPEFTSPAGPRTDSQYRSFTIVALRNAFSPSKIIARVGDVISIKVRAADGDYDFIQPDYGFSVPIAEGETKTIEFSATAPGTFTFYCGLCENNNVEGSIIVSAP